MPAIAVTGGIACGKSTVSLQLVQAIRELHLDALYFSADACAHRLLRDDSSVRSAVLNTFGTSVLGPDHLISRQSLREIITEHPEKRSELEQILHPAIRSAWSHDAQRARSSSIWFVAEIPLLFETNAAPHFDQIVAVVCSQTSQQTRLANRGWSATQIREIVIAQAPTESKMLPAHYVIWTDVPMHIVGRQTALLAESLLHAFAE
jgi:dephospho-CoA kinase